MNYKIIEQINSNENQVAQFREERDAEDFIEFKREQLLNKLIEKRIQKYKSEHGERWIPYNELDSIFQKCKIDAFQSYKLLQKE